jgi:hypothetical protein
MAHKIQVIKVIREVTMDKRDTEVTFCACCKQALPLRLNLIAAKRIADALEEAGMIDGVQKES